MAPNMAWSASSNIFAAALALGPAKGQKEPSDDVGERSDLRDHIRPISGASGTATASVHPRAVGGTLIGRATPAGFLPDASRATKRFAKVCVEIVNRSGRSPTIVIVGAQPPADVDGLTQVQLVLRPIAAEVRGPEVAVRHVQVILAVEIAAQLEGTPDEVTRRVVAIAVSERARHGDKQRSLNGRLVLEFLDALRAAVQQVADR